MLEDPLLVCVLLSHCDGCYCPACDDAGTGCLNTPGNPGNLLDLLFLLEILEIFCKFAKSHVNFLAEFMCLLL